MARHTGTGHTNEDTMVTHRIKDEISSSEAIDLNVRKRQHRISIYPASRNTKLLQLQLRASNAIRAPPPKPKRKYTKRSKAIPTIGLPNKNKELDRKSLPALDKFELFPNLPTELRVKIWKDALGAPRKLIVTIDWIISWQAADEDAEPSDFRLLPVVSVNHIHGAIRACRESNTEVKKLGGILRVNSASGLKTIYFNPTKDTIVLDDSSIDGLIACCTQFSFHGHPTFNTTFTNIPFHGFEAIQKLNIIGEGWKEKDSLRKGLSDLLSGVLVGVKSLRLPPKPSGPVNHRNSNEVDGEYHSLMRNFNPPTHLAAWPTGRTAISTHETLAVFAMGCWHTIPWSKPPGIKLES